MERKKQEIRKQEEIRRVAQAKEKERILREQLEMKRVREEAERRAAEAENLNSTYNKPADATFNRTVDQSHVSTFESSILLVICNFCHRSVPPATTSPPPDTSCLQSRP